MRNMFIFYICALILIQTNQMNIEVKTVEELHKALEKAKAGQTIQIYPGIYDFSTYQRSGKFYGTADGTKNSPIILTAKDPNNPPLLTGPTLDHNYILHITGDYWIIENIRVGYSSKGIVLDNSNYSIIRKVEVFSTGEEAIHIRDGSSNCLVQNVIFIILALEHQAMGRESILVVLKALMNMAIIVIIMLLKDVFLKILLLRL